MRFAGLPNIIHAKVVTTHLDRAEVSLGCYLRNILGKILKYSY